MFYISQNESREQEARANVAYVPRPTGEVEPCKGTPGKENKTFYISENESREQHPHVDVAYVPRGTKAPWRSGIL